MKHRTQREEEFESVYSEYANELFKFCLKLCKNVHDAEDLSQQAFYQMYERMETCEFRNPKSYLMTTAHNLFVNQVRHTKYEVLDALEESPEETKRRGSSVEDDFIREEERKERQELINQILQELRSHNHEWAEMIEAVFCQGKCQKEYAKELGITEVVLYSRIYRVRRWIYKRHEKELEQIFQKL